MSPGKTEAKQDKFVEFISLARYFRETYKSQIINPVIFLPAHPASFTHNFVSGMQSFYFSESQDAMVLQTCHEK